MSDYIPFEIQANIMKRLPAKSLMQFRTVSKPYKSLIDSSEFINEYSFNHTRQEHLLVSYFEKIHSDEYSYKHVTIVDDDTFPQEKLSLDVTLPGLVPWCESLPTILGSSHGLFWLYNQVYDQSEPHADFKKTITKSVLWNPSIRKGVTVDVLDHPVRIAGFGVCPNTRDPKVVNINFSREMSGDDTLICTPWHVDVYTLSSGAWRSMPTITQPRNSVNLVPQHVVTDEFIYWLAVDGYSRNVMTGYFESRYSMVVSFNLTTEKLMEVSLPDALANVYVDKLVMSKLKDCLVVLKVLSEAEKQSYGVWTMENGVPNTFTKLFTINSSDASIHGVLGFRKNSEPIFDMTTNEDELSEHRNDFSIQEFQSEHINYAGISGCGLSFSAFSYMETLLLHDHRDNKVEARIVSYGSFFKRLLKQIWS